MGMRFIIDGGVAECTCVECDSLECRQGGAYLCAESVFGRDGNVHKSRPSERAAFAYIMSDGVLFATSAALV